MYVHTYTYIHTYIHDRGTCKSHLLAQERDGEMMQLEHAANTAAFAMEDAAKHLDRVAQELAVSHSLVYSKFSYLEVSSRRNYYC